MFMYQCKMRKLFLGIFRRDKRFSKIILTPVSDPRQWLTGQVGRPHGRPTCIALCTSGSTVGRPTERSTGPESSALCIWAVGWAVDRMPHVHNSDRWRSAGRPTASLSGWQISLTASFWFGLYIPHFLGVLTKIFRAKISILSLLF